MKDIVKTILIIILVIATIILSIYSYNINQDLKLNEEALLKAINTSMELATEGRYSEAFLATIEEIKSDEPITGMKTIKVKGMDINEETYRNEFYLELHETDFGNNIKIQHNGKDISFDDLKNGQKIVVYDYSDYEEHINNSTLQYVQKIVVIDEKI